jgi:hypothetical protein
MHHLIIAVPFSGGKKYRILFKESRIRGYSAAHE